MSGYLNNTIYGEISSNEKWFRMAIGYTLLGVMTVGGFASIMEIFIFTSVACYFIFTAMIGGDPFYAMADKILEYRAKKISAQSH